MDKLTLIYKGIILKQNAVQTGDLMRSIDVKTSIKKDTLYIDITGVKYLNEVDARHNFTYIFVNSPEVALIIEEMIVKGIEEKFVKKIESASKMTNSKPIEVITDFKVRVNNKAFNL